MNLRPGFRWLGNAGPALHLSRGERCRPRAAESYEASTGTFPFCDFRQRGARFLSRANSISNLVMSGSRKEVRLFLLACWNRGLSAYQKDHSAWVIPQAFVHSGKIPNEMRQSLIRSNNLSPPKATPLTYWRADCLEYSPVMAHGVADIVAFATRLGRSSVNVDDGLDVERTRRPTLADPYTPAGVSCGPDHRVQRGRSPSHRFRGETSCRWRSRPTARRSARSEVRVL